MLIGDPPATRFTICVNLHNHTFFMNMVLSYIKPDNIAPITRAVFSFQFDTSDSYPLYPPIQGTTCPIVASSVPSPTPVAPKNAPSIHDASLLSPDVPPSTGDEEGVSDNSGSTSEFTFTLIAPTPQLIRQ